MKTWEERGPYGRWLVRARELRGFETAEEAREAMRATGIVIGESPYAEYEAGSKKPSRNHMPLLEGYWGPFSDPLGTTETPDNLVGALSAQTTAINDLVTLLRPLVEQATEGTEARLRTVESAVESLLVPQDDGASQVRSVRRETTE